MPLYALYFHAMEMHILMYSRDHDRIQNWLMTIRYKRNGVWLVRFRTIIVQFLIEENHWIDWNHFPFPLISEEYFQPFSKLCQYSDMKNILLSKLIYIYLFSSYTFAHLTSRYLCMLFIAWYCHYFIHCQYIYYIYIQPNSNGRHKQQ